MARMRVGLPPPEVSVPTGGLPDLRGPRDDEKTRDPWCPRCGACGAMSRVQERIAREGRAVGVRRRRSRCGACGAMSRVQERIAREGRAVGVRRAAESVRAEAAVGAARAAGAMKVL
ncbi:hypothetical protein AAFF_G00303120 [Aldrovandia affinis]|uniref:Uncharacterized protein n=1 Tax=Aldrovandia affinis TaxID=143900 RepID=A0AAD7W0Z7_9TELE|nr:hypothetical protein AAFF_G00303120 [Aldrovandia affinis]